MMEAASKEVATLMSLRDIARGLQQRVLALCPELAAEVQSYTPPQDLQPPLRLLTTPNIVDDILGLPISHEYVLLLRPLLLRFQESWAESLRSAWERIIRIPPVPGIPTPLQAMEVLSRACLNVYEHSLLPRMKQNILSAAQSRASIPDIPSLSHQKFNKVSLTSVLCHSLILLFRTVFSS
jgi:hypothetical protein